MIIASLHRGEAWLASLANHKKNTLHYKMSIEKLRLNFKFGIYKKTMEGKYNILFTQMRESKLLKEKLLQPRSFQFNLQSHNLRR